VCVSRSSLLVLAVSVTITIVFAVAQRADRAAHFSTRMQASFDAFLGLKPSVPAPPPPNLGLTAKLAQARFNLRSLSARLMNQPKSFHMKHGFHDFQIVFGVGTGRCGTVSLYKLLKVQPFSIVTHEDRTLQPPPRWVDPSQVAAIQSLVKSRVAAYRSMRGQYGNMLVGDVWSAHLPYIEAYINEDPSIKVIVLERDREGVVQSFMKKTSVDVLRNHWMPWEEGVGWEKDDMWDPFFPKFPNTDGNMTREKAIGLYWDLYHKETERLVKLYPMNVIKYQTHQVLANNATGVRSEMLRFAGIYHPKLGHSWHSNRNDFRKRPDVVPEAPKDFPNAVLQVLSGYEKYFAAGR